MYEYGHEHDKYSKKIWNIVEKLYWKYILQAKINGGGVGMPQAPVNVCGN